MQASQAYIRIRNSEVFFETSGRGDPLLLLHGGLGTVEDFASNTRELAKHFKVIAFERPGHGHTADIEEPFSFDLMVGYTIDFIQAFKMGPMNILGWSDGAIISLLIAISRPDLVSRMICVSGSFDTSYYTPKTVEWLRSVTSESFRKDMPTLAKRYDDASPDGPAHFSIVLKKTMEMWLNEPNIPREELAKISVPVMIMAGDKDVIPVEYSVRLFRSIRNAKLQIVAGATHWLLSEKPEVTNAAIIDFLGEERAKE